MGDLLTISRYLDVVDLRPESSSSCVDSLFSPCQLAPWRVMATGLFFDAALWGGRSICGRAITAVFPAFQRDQKKSAQKGLDFTGAGITLKGLWGGKSADVLGVPRLHGGVFQIGLGTAVRKAFRHFVTAESTFR